MYVGDGEGGVMGVGDGEGKGDSLGMGERLRDGEGDGDDCCLTRLGIKKASAAPAPPKPAHFNNCRLFIFDCEIQVPILCIPPTGIVGPGGFGGCGLPLGLAGDRAEIAFKASLAF